MAFSTLRLKSLDTSQIGDPLRGNRKEQELFGELPGVRRRDGGEGILTDCKQIILKKMIS